MSLDIARKQKDLALKAKKRNDQRIGGLHEIITQEEWITQAFWNILENEGSETSGIDGKEKTTYYDVKTRNVTSKGKELIRELCKELKENTYKPEPVKRIYIPKSNGKMRPIGIPNFRDRVVQESIRMVLEPIYESDFLNCSYGFRPNRNTMDAISNCYRLITDRFKYYWVLEGDIKGCFDNIDHKILLKLIRKRVADRKLTGIIYRMLKAGYREEGKTIRPTVGTPQGGILSPLLANIFLHELDRWWETKYHLERHKREYRRKRGLANFILIRYADDFIVLSNGGKDEIEELRNEIAEFLKEMGLELSMEKTKVTHAFDGFDFLGFHVRKFEEKKAVLIMPTKTNIQKLKDKISRHLDRREHEESAVNIIKALNPILRGWGNYYRFVNSKEKLHDIEYYLSHKFQKWYRGKYQMGMRKGTMEALKWMDRDNPLHLFNISVEIKVKRYRPEKDKLSKNPYIDGNLNRKMDSLLVEREWFGQSERNGDLRLECFKRDRGICQLCMGCKTNIEAHHIIPIEENGEDILENLITLCESCHKRVTYEIGWKEFKRLVESRVR